MLQYILKRLTMAFATVMFIICILFLLLQYMPGSPFNDEKLTEEQKSVLYQKYGLDKPVYEQMGIYVKNMVSGDFGVSYSIQPNYAIRSMLASRFPITVRIGLQGFLFGTLAGMLLGIIAALNHNGIWDSITSVIAMLGSSIPSYVIALGLVFGLAYKLGLFPLMYSKSAPFVSTILPSLALSIWPMAVTARFTRTEMIEVMDSDYILLAEAKGMERVYIITVHGLRNAMIPLITSMGSQLVGVITGSTVVESIFSVPGIGSLFVTAIQSNDYNIVITLAFIFSAIYIGVVLAIDILYGVIDPRIRLTSGGGKDA